MPPILTKNGDALELALSGCRGMEFQDAKEKIKEIPGRAFDWDTKMWTVPATPPNAERILKTLRPQVDQDLMNWITASKATHEESLTSPLPDDAKLLIPWATERQHWQPSVVNDEPFTGLLQHQRPAVQVMAESGRAILADDMGLGKTLTTLSAVAEWKLNNGQPDGPSLVVAPSSVKGSWAREVDRWLEDDEFVIVNAATPAKRAKQIEWGVENNAWVIVNWEQLRIKKAKRQLRNGGHKTVTVMKEPLLSDTEWIAVVADEVHRAKNRKAQQTQGLWRIAGKVMYGLTGTPIMNSPDELWAVLRWLYPDEYGRSSPNQPRIAYWAFYEDYVDYWEDHFGKKVITGVKNPDALRYALKGKLIRRTAAILGLKGRKRIYYTVQLNKEQQKLYDEAEKAMWLAVQKDVAAGNKDAIAFAQKAAAGGTAFELYQIQNGASRMVRLQQIIENAALLGGSDDSAIMDDFEQKFSDSRPEPWVFFFKHKESCQLMAERLRNKHGAIVGIYNGDVKPEDRTKLEDSFQRGEVDAICGTVEAMKEGITLTRSHLMAFGTRSWVPATNEQCESREDRLGQQDLVRVYIPLAFDTVAANKVEPTNQLKEVIVKTVIPKHEAQEDRTDV